MPSTPDVASIAALIGDPTRARVLVALMDGRALTATELARSAGVTKQTTSAHLSRLAGAGLVVVEPQGRHRYFRLSAADIGEVLENLMGVAARLGALRVATGPGDPALSRARVCYDHLAGELGVLIYDSLTQRKLLRHEGRKLVLSPEAAPFFWKLQIDVAALPGRRPLCLPCLDWSVRRYHLAGALGAELLRRCFALGWARQARNSRVVNFSALGERALRIHFPLPG